jgi:hypothetical protein
VGSSAPGVARSLRERPPARPDHSEADLEDTSEEEDGAHERATAARRETAREQGRSGLLRRCAFCSRFCWRDRQNGIMFGRTGHDRDCAPPHRPRARLPDHDFAVARQGLPVRAVVFAVRGRLFASPWGDARQLAFGETPV